MALFGTKKNKVEKTDKSTKAVSTKAVAVSNIVTQTVVGAGAIIRPKITEKAGILSQSGVYTFEIAESANKNTVATAIKSLYKVTPVKVAVINTPSKRVFVRGRRGVVPGVRKALVTLKKGDKIDFV